MTHWRKRPRIAIYSHDTYGLGHLTRSTRVARGLRDAFPDASVLVLTGSPIAHRFTFPPGVDYLKLPSVVKTGRDAYGPRELTISYRRIRAMRSQVLLDAMETFRPHLLLVDNVPLGMKGELLPAIDRLRARSPDAQIHLDLRDILDDPDVLRSDWKRSGTYDVLSNLYDAVHIFGSRSIYDAIEAYDLPRGKAVFLGYIDPSVEDTDEIGRGRTHADHFEVLVTIGGGGDGAGIIECVAEIQASFGSKSPYRFRVVGGPLMDLPTRRRIEQKLAGLPGVVLHEYVDALPSSMAAADVVVSMGGYNTLCEVITHAKRSIVVPRVQPRREQEIRARAFERRGLLRVLHPDDLDPASLERTLRLTLTAGPRVSSGEQPPLDGIPRLKERIRQLVCLRAPAAPDGPAPGAGERAPKPQRPGRGSRFADPGALAISMLAVSLSLGLATTRAASIEIRPEQVEATLSLGYDGNLLDAADAERGAFDGGDPGALFVVDRMDDAFVLGEVEGEWALGRPLGLKTKLTAGYARAQFLYNPIKSEDSYAVEIQAKPSQVRRLSLGVSHSPQVYGRHRFDKDALPGAPQFRAETHRRWDLAIGYRQAIGDRLAAGAKLERTWKDYCEPFVERDRRRWGFFGGADWNAHRHLALGIEAGFRRSTSRNEPDLGSDLSYREWIVEPGITIVGIGHVTLEVDYELSLRHYTSDDPEDASHYGRDDRLGYFRLTAQRAITPALRLHTTYSRGWRSAELNESERSVEFDEEGSYSEDVVYGGFTWHWER